MLRAGSPALVDPPVVEEVTPPMQSDLPTPSELERRGEEVGRGGEITRVTANPTVGPDNCRGWAIYVGRGGASSQEALTYHGRQGPPEGILAGCTSEEALKVLIGDSYSLQDLPVSKEQGTPHLENALLTASP